MYQLRNDEHTVENKLYIFIYHSQYNKIFNFSWLYYIP